MPRELRVLSKVSRVIMSARGREGSPRGSMVKLSGLSESSHGGVGSSCGVARPSSVAKREGTASMTSEGEDAVVLSGLVMRWRVEAAPAGGRRPLLIFSRRWESLGQVSYAALARVFIFLNLSVVVGSSRWRMRAWHCCLMASGVRYSVVFKRAWARGRGPLFLLHLRSFRMCLRLFLVSQVGSRDA